jgi:hypothetical protein
MEKVHALPEIVEPPVLSTLLCALARARKKFKPIPMSGNSGGDEAFAYSTWDDICLALDPPLLEEGILFVAREEYTTFGWHMRGRLFHADTAEFLESLTPIKDGNSGDPRAYMAACTYARKNLYLA